MRQIKVRQVGEIKGFNSKAYFSSELRCEAEHPRVEVMPQWLI